MKKLIAIVLIAVHLFNAGGIVALHEYLVYKTDKFFDLQTSKNHYNIGDLTEIKISVNMPGIADWSRYENVNGSVRFQDVGYNYVKMKMTRNAIYLMCVPNYKTTKLSADNIIHAENMPAIPVPKKDHVPYSKQLMQDKSKFAIVRFAFAVPCSSLSKAIVPSVINTVTQTREILQQPPKSC